MNILCRYYLNISTLLYIYFSSSFFLGCRTRKAGGVNPNPDPNQPCAFPFWYNGQKFTKCTSVDSKGSFWCSTEHSWGECEESCFRDEDGNLHNKYVNY